MQEIIFRQHNAADYLTGKTFVLRIAGMIVRLAIAQMVIHLLVSLTGIGLLHAAFYLYALWLLTAFMHSIAASYVYTLKPDTLVLERRLGDSTITAVEIPLERVVCLREMRMGENLHISYRNVMHIDPQSMPPLRVRAAFIASLFSSKLARLLAGKRTQEVIGHVIVYDEGKLRCARTFCPNEELLALLSDMLGDGFGFDERMTHARVRTLYSRALERAFPSLYPYVDPLLRREDVEWANEEIARQKAERQARKAAGRRRAQAADAARQETTQSETQNEQMREAPRRRRKQG